MARYNNGRITNLANALGLEDDDYVEDAGEEMSEAELVEAGNEVDSGVDDVETAIDTGEDIIDDSETLTNVGEVVDESIDSGEGLSEDAAAVVEETIENILRRHGMKRHLHFSYPSMENFDSRAGRVRAAKQLKVSIESFIDTLLEGLKGLIESIKVGFSRIFGSLSSWEDGIANACDKLSDRLKAGGGDFASWEQSVNSASSASGKKAGSALARKLTPGFVKNLYHSSSEEVDISFVSTRFNDFITEVNNKMPKIEQEILKHENEDWSARNFLKSDGTVKDQADDSWVSGNDNMTKMQGSYLFNSYLSDRAPHGQNAGSYVRKGTSVVKYFNIDSSNTTAKNWQDLVNSIRTQCRKHALKKLEKHSFNAIERFFNWFKDLFAKIGFGAQQGNVYAQSDARVSENSSANANIGNNELRTAQQNAKGQLYQFRKVITENTIIYKDSIKTAYDAAKFVLDKRMAAGEIGSGQRTIK